MSANAMHAVNALNQAFLREHPLPALQVLNKLSVDDLVELLQAQPAADRIKLWDGLMQDVATAVLQRLPEAKVKQIM